MAIKQDEILYIVKACRNPRDPLRVALCLHNCENEIPTMHDSAAISNILDNV